MMTWTVSKPRADRRGLAFADQDRFGRYAFQTAPSVQPGFRRSRPHRRAPRARTGASNAAALVLLDLGAACSPAARLSAHRRSWLAPGPHTDTSAQSAARDFHCLSPPFRPEMSR